MNDALQFIAAVIVLLLLLLVAIAVEGELDDRSHDERDIDGDTLRAEFTAAPTPGARAYGQLLQRHRMTSLAEVPAHYLR